MNASCRSSLSLEKEVAGKACKYGQRDALFLRAPTRRALNLHSEDLRFQAPLEQRDPLLSDVINFHLTLIDRLVFTTHDGSKAPSEHSRSQLRGRYDPPHPASANVPRPSPRLDQFPRGINLHILELYWAVAAFASIGAQLASWSDLLDALAHSFISTVVSCSEMGGRQSVPRSSDGCRLVSPEGMSHTG